MLARFIPGIPAPQGSKRHVGNGRIIESSKKVAPWRKAVAEALADIPKPMFVTEPVSVQVIFFLPRPTTVRRVWPIVPPDIDKLDRGLLDALTLAGVWSDDAQVVEMFSVKQYADFHEPGAWINVEPVTHIPAPIIL